MASTILVHLTWNKQLSINYPYKNHKNIFNYIHPRTTVWYNELGDLMKIVKFKKKNKDKYEILLDNGQTLDLYEDVIVHHSLIAKKEIDDETLEKIRKENNTSEIYTKCIKYISIRMRSKKEIKDYLQKKEYDNSIIEDTILKLEKNGLLNEEQFVKAYINDKLLMTNYGPYKIKSELNKHNIDDSIIDKYIDNIDNDLLIEKIEKIINKYLKTNRKNSNYTLKNKVQEQLNILGFPKYLYQEKLDNINIDNETEILKKEAIKEFNKLSRKYEGNELKIKLKQKLYQKGFRNVNIDNILEEYLD